MGAYNVKFPLVTIDCINEETEFLFATSASRMLIVNTAMIAAKATRDTQGVQALTMKKGVRLVTGKRYVDGMVQSPHRLRTKNLPAVGALVKDTEFGEQLTL